VPDEQSMRPMQPMHAMNGVEAIDHLFTQTNEKATAGDGQERDDAVGQLAGALRTAKRAHGAYLTELRQGDVEPAEGLVDLIRRVPARTALMDKAE
jgi:hypothetical protein